MPPAFRLLFNLVPALAIVAVLVWPAALLVQADLKLRVLAALGGFGQPALVVSVDGRDVLLSGRADGYAGLNAARKTLAGLEGVRVLYVAAEVEKPRFQPEAVETAPVEPVIAGYLDAPVDNLPLVEPAAAPVRAATLPKCAQTAVEMRGRRDGAQGPGATVCRPAMIKTKLQE